MELCINEFMPHAHCLGDCEFLEIGFTINDIITFIFYAGLTSVLIMSSNANIKLLLDNKRFMYLLAAVYFTCGINYLLHSIVIYHPIYYWQLGFATLNTLLTTAAFIEGIVFFVGYRKYGARVS